MTRKADECRATADGIELIGEVNHAGAPSDARIDRQPPSIAHIYALRVHVPGRAEWLKRLQFAPGGGQEGYGTPPLR